MKTIKIGNKTISSNGGLYFVADIAANHDGDLNRAFRLIELAKAAGADAAKFQNFQAAKIVSKQGFEAMGAKLSHQSGWKKSVYDTYQDASIPFDWTEKLKAKCEEVGIEYFTSPYDFESVDFVDPFVNVYKIGSGDITWLDIIEHIAKKNKPVMLAAGASDLADVERAMSVLSKYTDDIVLMQCNTNYTASLENFNYINLKVLETFAHKFPGTILGLSDHTPGHATVLGAVALGARVFEKHFTDDNEREGPDHKFAMNPQSWRAMVDAANEVFKALGDGVKRVEANELESAKLQRRSIRVNKALPAGHLISASDLCFLRPIPEGALAPYQATEVIGKKIINSVAEGECLLTNNLHMKSIAIIPARGGSKRIPRKNIKTFIDKPIIAYSIIAALESGCFDEVMVSTDDQEIAEIARSYGASVPFLRSAANSSDMAMTAPVLLEVLEEYHKLGRDFEAVCCIYPTAPFVTGPKLLAAAQLLVESGASCVLPTAKFSYPIQRSLKITNGMAEMFWPENYNVRSQDLEPAYHDCGQFYFLTVKSLLAEQVLFPEATLPLIVPETEVQDIDNEVDWQLAELKYQFLHSK